MNGFNKKKANTGPSSLKEALLARTPRGVGSSGFQKAQLDKSLFCIFFQSMIKFQMVIFLLIILFSGSVWAQKEVTSPISRYGNREAVSEYYERFEAKPRAHLPFLEKSLPRKALITLASTAEAVRIRKYLSDSHMGLKFYDSRTCKDCHPDQARDVHSIRIKITCRQCHGREPIAGISHYYSPMNPRRRYAFICAKCHEGSSASFATYRIHPPNPALASTFQAFPVLSIVFWGMVVLAGGTFLVFLPHTAIWGIRELFLRKKKEKSESKRKK